MNQLNNLNKIDFIFTFLTNFKPSNINLYTENKLFKLKTNKKIICRNFFLFLLFIKYLNKKTLNNSNIWIKPIKQKTITLLRAPYRHKLFRHQIVLNRYFFFYKISFNLNSYIKAKSFNELKLIVNFFKKFNIWIESNIVFNFKIKYLFYFSLSKFFLL